MCPTFESLKKLITILSETEWDLISPDTRKEITTAYICHGDKTAVTVEDGGITIFEFGTRNDVSYSIFTIKN